MSKALAIEQDRPPDVHRGPGLLGKADFPSRVIVISPHIDDAAFSLAATLKVLVAAGSAVQIINCFTLSRYAPFSGTNSKISAITRRRHEEEAFLHYLGGKSSSADLGLVDAPARTGVGLRGIMASHLPLKELSETVAMLAGGLDDADDDTAIMAPLAIGDHSDHYIARQAAILKYHDRPIAFYEDLPYAATANESHVANSLKQTAESFAGGLKPLLFHWPGDAAWKRQSCSHYKSQISEAGILKMLDYMERIRGERLWCSARFIDSWEWQLTPRPSRCDQGPYFL
ncbi:MAG: PIG-L deacetylase family protein [Candidatus Angelobacter sp.]